jgi:hypothetical protein
MTTCRYCTPEWLEESFLFYNSTDQFQKELEKLTTSVVFRVKAEHDWGIEQDILFGAVLKKGQLQKLTFYNEQDAKEQVEFILSATPQEWKKILRKEKKFLTDFMLGKIALEQGNKVAVLGLAPYSNQLIDALTQVELQFPDEMNPEALEEYRTYQEHFRDELKV